jgi:tetratricopeptide (TPR) repeat protein
MIRITHKTLVVRTLACVLVLAGCCAASGKTTKAKQSSDKVPITTSSEEARQCYLQGRDLAEKLRATDAHAQYEKAVKLDPNFALAYLGLANTSGTNKEFIENVSRAAELAPKASEGERHIILGAESGMKADPAGTISHYTALVKLYPNDERAVTLLGNTYFGRQDYKTAITYLERATKINPSFSQPYNQLGYAYRFLERYDDAEKTFQKYIQLIPDDPNPYDSYAELLMKMGRFDDSIKNYQKALSIDPNFIASYIGMGHDHLYMGHPEEARASFAKIGEVARNTGEKRAAHFWTASTYVYEGKTDEAVKEIKAESALAEAENDLASIAGDFTQIGDIEREAGHYDEALASYKESVTVIEKAQVPEQVKEATRRNLIFEEGRVAALKNDLPTAKARSAEYAKQVAEKKRPFEVRQQHELAGMIALAEKQNGTAVAELQQANQQDPRVLYMTSQALYASGKPAEGAKFANKANKFNGLSFNYAYLRNKPDSSEVQASAK